jgi:hypothetical protein
MEDQAARRLMAQQLDKEMLVDIVLESEKLREEAAAKLFVQEGFSNKARAGIIRIIETVPELAERAARALLKTEGHRHQKTAVRCIIEHVESCREEAAKQLLAGSLADVDRKLLRKYVPHML